MSNKLHQGDLLPEFQYDTPYQPGKSFYQMVDEKGPVVMVFLRNFGHPLSRHYIMEYSQTIKELRDARLVCVVRTKPQIIAEALPQDQLPYELICDAEGALYEHFGVRTESNWLRSYSLKTLRILKSAKKQGFEEKRKEPQQMPLTLVVSRDGEVLFAHYGRSLTDLPDDCVAMQKVVENLLASLPPMATEVEEAKVYQLVNNQPEPQEEWGQLLQEEEANEPEAEPAEQEPQDLQELLEQPNQPKEAEVSTAKKAPVEKKIDIDFEKLGF